MASANTTVSGAVIATCTVRWRPSGGRGEFEFVPSDSLVNRRITLELPALKATIAADITGTLSQGKPRLRKDEPNNRKKLHLVPLVMAAARLPDPAREDKFHKPIWPLENKRFLISHMEFEIVQRTSTNATLRPLSARILHSDETINLAERFTNIANDIKELSKLAKAYPAIAKAIEQHRQAVRAGVNDSMIRTSADTVIGLQAAEFGASNIAAVTTIAALPPSPFEDEDVKGKEGRVLTRLHSYRERDRTLVKKAKKLFKLKNSRLFCECCGFEAQTFYGARGEDRIQAHHRRAVEELLPDSVTTAEDLAMVCPNCHDIIHAERPWLTVEALKQELLERGKHYFG